MPFFFFFCGDKRLLVCPNTWTAAGSGEPPSECCPLSRLSLGQAAGVYPGPRTLVPGLRTDGKAEVSVRKLAPSKQAPELWANSREETLAPRARGRSLPSAGLGDSPEIAPASGWVEFTRLAEAKPTPSRREAPTDPFCYSPHLQRGCEWSWPAGLSYSRKRYDIGPVLLFVIVPS